MVVDRISEVGTDREYCGQGGAIHGCIVDKSCSTVEYGFFIVVYSTGTAEGMAGRDR